MTNTALTGATYDIDGGQQLLAGEMSVDRTGGSRSSPAARRASARAWSPGTAGAAGPWWPTPARSSRRRTLTCSPWPETSPTRPPRDRIIDAALDRFGRIDTLVNNAGVFISKPFTDYTAEDYALITGVNLAGFFWLTRRAIAEMLRARHGGHVVNISATLADHANSGAPSALTALTKGGLAAATKSLAIEYASRGIRVNAVSPGIIQTPMHPAESYESLGDRLPPLGRVGQISDVVDGILFLESSPYITGEILHVDGGQTAGH